MNIKNMLVAVEMLSLLPFCKEIKSKDVVLDVIRTKLLDDREKDLSFDEMSELMLLEVNRSCNKVNYYSIRHSLQVKDFEDKEYIFTLFNPCGYSAMNSKTLETVEFVPFADIDIKEYRSDYRYVPTVGLLYEEGDSYKGVFTDYEFKKGDIEIKEEKKEYGFNRTAIKEKVKLFSSNPSTGTGRKDWVIDIDSREVIADVEVPHSWFFKYNTTQFAYADTDYSWYKRWFNSHPDAPRYSKTKGLCEYIAFLLMLEYHEFFSSSGYISSSEKTQYMTFPQRTNQSFKEAIPRVDDTWILDLWKLNDYAINIGGGSVNRLCNRELNNKTIDYSTIYMYFGLGNPKDVIDHNRPDMISKKLPNPSDNTSEYHNIVAYGYFNQGTYKDKYLTHYGWDTGDLTQCILSCTPNIYDWSIINNNVHVCANNFYVNNQWRCGCESN